jgi:hypothetical protein
LRAVDKNGPTIRDFEPEGDGLWRVRKQRWSLLPSNAANVNGKITLPKKIGGICRKSWNLINTVPLTGSIPYIRKQR